MPNYRIKGKIGYMTWTWDYGVNEEIEAANEDEAIMAFVNRDYSFADDHNTEDLRAERLPDPPAPEPEPVEFALRRMGAPTLPGFEGLVPHV